MKQILLLFIGCIIFLFDTTAQSQYSIRNVNINNIGGIQDVKFIDSSRGIAISHYEVFSTSDAGENWQLKFTIPKTSGLEVINHLGDSIIVTGFYGFTGPSHLAFLFSDTAFQLTNLPNTYNLSYVSPIFFNDSMWSTYGTSKPATDGLLVIKRASYRRIDSNRCVLDIYDNRISFFNGSELKYSLDSAKSWTTVSNLPIARLSQSSFQTYFDGDSTLYMHKHGSFLENYQDSSYISYDLGLNWTMLGSGSKPRRFHFIDDQQIVGVDSNLLYYSVDRGLNFSTQQIDSTSAYYRELWIHSAEKFFSWSHSKGLLLIEKNVITNIDKQQADQLSFSIVPNPAENSFKIDINSKEVDQVQIFDLSGRRMLVAGGGQTTFDLRNYPNGIYFVSIISKGERLSKKLVVKH